jgi:DNA-binding MarR family transcriptional regulator
MAKDCPCNFMALRQATRRVTQLYDQAFAPLSLRATQYSLLSQIEKLGPIAINPLAEAMVMDRATLGHNLRPLEERGLVRLAVGQDRRSRDVSITRAGRDLLVEARKLWRKAQDSFENTIGRAQAATLRATHNKVSASDFLLS